MGLEDDNGGDAGDRASSMGLVDLVDTSLDQSQFHYQFSPGQRSISVESDGILPGADCIQDSRELVPKLSMKAFDGVVAVGLSEASECAQLLTTIGSDMTLAVWNTTSFKELHRIKPVLKLACSNVASPPEHDNFTRIKDSHIRAFQLRSCSALTRSLCELSTPVPSKVLPSDKKLRLAGAPNQTGIVLPFLSDPDWWRTESLSDYRDQGGLHMRSYKKQCGGVDIENLEEMFQMQKILVNQRRYSNEDFVNTTGKELMLPSLFPHVSLASRPIDHPNPEPIIGSGSSIFGFFGFLSLVLFIFLGARAKKKRKTVDKKSQEIQEQMKIHGQKGFANLRSTCYLAVTFQSFLSLDCLKPALDEIDVLGPTTGALKDVLYGEDKNMVGNITPFIRSLEATNYPINIDVDGSPLTVFETIMNHIIEGEHPSIAALFKTWRRTEKRFDCKHSAPVQEKASFYIYLHDLPGKKDPITQAFNGLFRPSKAPNERLCPVCIKEKSYSVSWLMLNPASVLVLELKFKNNSSSRSVKFDEVLVVDKKTIFRRDVEEAGIKKISYQLKSVIQSVRREKHFIAFVRRMVGGVPRWYRADDDVVERIDADDVLKVKRPTLLVYELIKC